MHYPSQPYKDEIRERVNEIPKALLAQIEAVTDERPFRAAQTKTKKAPSSYRDPVMTSIAFADCDLPLAGFSIMDSGDLDEVIQLAAWAPCACLVEVVECS